MSVEAEALKNEGNALYQGGDCKAALAAYGKALALLGGVVKTEGEDAQITKLRATILSNSSQVHYEMKKYAASEEAATQAVANERTLVKGWYRLVRAQVEAKYPLSAFISVQQLREAAKGNADMVDPIADMETRIYQGLGVKEMSPSLKTVPVAGGIGCIAGSDIPNGKRLFVENLVHLAPGGASMKSSQPGNEYEEAMSQQQDTTSEEMILAFVKLITLKKNETVLVTRWRNSMRGSWPRALEETPDRVMEKLTVALDASPHKAKWKDDEEGWKATVLLAIQLRYNKFQRGFYRVCALINHGCLANCAMKSGASGSDVNLVTVRDIAAGDTLSVSYLGEMDSFQGPFRRRRVLFRSWQFWCDCSRCVTELDPSNPVEQLKCSKSGCAGYVSAPGPAGLGEAEDEHLAVAVDPMLPAEPHKCSECGTPRSWTNEEREIVVKVFDVVGTIGQSDLGTLASTVLGALNLVKPFIHEGHWLHRSMLVVLFMHAEGVVDQMFNLVARSGQGFESAQLGQLPPVVVGGVDEARLDGGVYLHYFRDLWRRMESFYPREQGYRVHVNIVRMALLNLVITYNKVEQKQYQGTVFRPMTLGEAKSALRAHVRDLPAGEQKQLLNLFQNLAGKNMPAQDLKEIKECFQV